MGSYVYEAGLFDDHVLEVVHDNMITWRKRLREKLDEVAARHPPRVEVDLDSLADLMTVVFEGAFIVSRTLRQPDVVAEQLQHYGNYLELLFAEG